MKRFGDDQLPHWAGRLVYRLASPHNSEIVLGDFAECFAEIADERGRRSAFLWFWLQVLRSIPSFLSNSFYFTGVMFQNYLKVAVRNLFKRKFYASLNIIGLAVGMAVCLIIFQYVAFEFSYDAYHKNTPYLYRITSEQVDRQGETQTSTYTYFGMEPALREAVPELERIARFHPNYGQATIVYTDSIGQEQAVREEGLVYVDPAYLSMFTVPFVQGDAETALREPGTIVLSASMARKYFGAADPMEKVLDVRGWIEGPFRVVGVFEDMPPNTSESFDMLIPMDDLVHCDHCQYQNASGWDWTNFYTFVQLKQGVNPQDVEAKISEVVASHLEERLTNTDSSLEMNLQPVAEMHLYSDFDEAFEAGGDYRTVYFFSIIALFILLLAWINYINLATARAMERAKEVGIRKVAGAWKGQLMTQFVLESALINAIALGGALILAWWGLPYLNDITGINVSGSSWSDSVVWLTVLGIFLFGTLPASLYPAVVLSGFQPAAILKGQPGSPGAGQLLRKGLVVFQFTATIALLIGTYSVYSQVEYMRGIDTGIDMDQILVVRGPSIIDDAEDYQENRRVFEAELAQRPEIGMVTTSTAVPGWGFNLGTVYRREGAPEVESERVKMAWVYYNFLDAYDLELLAGRTFSEEFSSDRQESVLLNETAIRTLGYQTVDEAIGERINLGGGESIYTVIGVFEDVYWESAKKAIEPNILGLTPGGGLFSIKVNAGETARSVEAVREVYQSIFPGNPYDYFFADQFFDEQYRDDQQFGTLFGIFAVFALLVACLGLVGLAAFATARRTKEIGVRKVLGAGIPGIVRLFFFDFGKLILIALVIAIPIMYWALNAWLAGFASRIELSSTLFILPGLLALMLALAAVSYHTLRIAMTNPVHALRQE